jgi:hypothetical protein
MSLARRPSALTVWRSGPRVYPVYSGQADWSLSERSTPLTTKGALGPGTTCPVSAARSLRTPLRATTCTAGSTATQTSQSYITRHPHASVAQRQPSSSIRACNSPHSSRPHRSLLSPQRHRLQAKHSSCGCGRSCAAPMPCGRRGNDRNSPEAAQGHHWRLQCRAAHCQSLALFCTLLWSTAVHAGPDPDPLPCPVDLKLPLGSPHRRAVHAAVQELAHLDSAIAHLERGRTLPHSSIVTKEQLAQRREEVLRSIPLQGCGRRPGSWLRCLAPAHMPMVP